MTGRIILKNARERLKTDIYYRLDIVTGLDLRGAYRESQRFQTVNVNFSEYSPEYQNLEKIQSLSIDDRFKTSIKGVNLSKNAVVLQEDITNLIFLKPGTVWFNGELVWEPSDFLSIDINQTSKSIQFVKDVQKSHQLPYIEGGYYSNLIMLPGSNTNGHPVTVFIPAMEVIRYYFTGSRYFTTTLFNGGMESEQIQSSFIHKSKFNKEELSVYIWLRRKCFDSDAVLLARAIADKAALDAMRMIYSSLINVIDLYSRNDWTLEHCCPKTKLPFDDNSVIYVQGQPLVQNSEGRITTYLVRTIDRCSHALPFKSIQIESADSYSSNEEQPSQLKITKKKKIVNNQNPSNPILTEGQLPNEKYGAQELEFSTQRFAGFYDVRINKVNKSSENDLRRFTKYERINLNTDQGATQIGNFHDGNRLPPWETVVKQDDTGSISQRLLLTSTVIKKFNENNKSVVVTALPENLIDNSYPYGLYSFDRPSGKTAHYNWSNIENRKRRALFLEIKNKKDSVFLLEIESDKSATYSLYVLVNDNELNFLDKAKSFLQEIAEKSGSKIIGTVFKKYFTVKSLRHATTDEEGFETRLHTVLYKELNLE